MIIGVDAMGGDYAPQSVIEGLGLVIPELDESSSVLLIGDQEVLKPLIHQYNIPSERYELLHTDEVIDMKDVPAKAIVRKPNSSISLGFNALETKKIDAFCSAGNSGAMLVGSIFSVNTVPGVIRPAIATLVPKKDDTLGLLLDVGANADCKPDVLVDFALLGSIYMQHIGKINNPRVALMSVGEEESKGNQLTLAAYALMKNSEKFNFIGNVEGRDLFSDRADVIVCDGFTGNIMLKLAESFYFMLRKQGISTPYFERFNYTSYGGCPILGVNAPIVVGHGISNASAIKNMILMTENMVLKNVVEKIKSKIKDNG